jgi:hypothetical protein
VSTPLRVGPAAASGPTALAAALRGEPPSLAHCRALLDRHGMVQFALGEARDVTSGYCLDDNARALIVAVRALALDAGDEDAPVVGESALGFVERAARADGRFHNMMDQHGRFVDDVGSEDAAGRAVWACGVAAHGGPAAWRGRANSILQRALRPALELRWPRSRAYAALGFAAARLTRGAPYALRRLADDLADQLEANAVREWYWWEPALTYGNARLPHALLAAAECTGSTRHRRLGLEALEFLAGITQCDAYFEPIGNAGWHARGGALASHDQQPIEACAMVDAWLAAEAATGDATYARHAACAFEWFLGANSEGLMVARPGDGACHDGLGVRDVNANMGAESTLAYVHAHQAIAARARKAAAR